MLVKVGLFLSFGAFACGYLKIIARLVGDSHSFKKALSVS
ncbi:putative membrane protein [Helicobacter pylori R055a]|nr:putative membrane protein [Helicobacter pylori R055a]